MTRISALIPAVLVATTWLPAARADVAPPPDYVEQCTLANHQAARTECVSCGDA